ncbi:hypothetical protein BDF19DRAFT_444212 [Syncephalis fuscata]|nr:hypothetical protein BDF19DRAFT_444212 [Syncephalis fuscata]
MLFMWQSPNDPIFWLHHAFVDKQWSDWQRLRPRNSQAYGGINQDGSPARPSDQLQPYPYRVLDVLDTRDLCYTYAPFRVGSHFNPDDIESNPMPASTPMLAVSNRTAIDPLDRTEILGLRIPTPIPDSWLVMNHANVTAVRETEMFLRNVALEINNLRSHVSPSVPASQPDILAGLIKKIKPGNGQLTATRRGRQIVLNSTLLENLTTDEVVGKVQQFLDSLRELPVVIQDNIEEATLESIIGSESAEQLRDNYDI